MFTRVLWWVMGVSAVVMWTLIPISSYFIQHYETRVEWVITTAIVGAASIVFSVSLLMSVYQGFKSLEQRTGQGTNTRHIDATQAVAYLFLPLFNIYWQFVAFAGWCKRARQLQSDNGQTTTVPPMGLAIFGIVAGWLAGLFLFMSPPIGTAFGLASTGAYLIVAHAMLTWQDGPMPTAQVRGMAYFGLVDNRIDVRLVVGTILTSFAAIMGASTLMYFLTPFPYSLRSASEAGFIDFVVLDSIYVGFGLPLIIGVPAIVAAISDIRSPWVLVPLIIPTTLAAAMVVTTAFRLWNGIGLPELDDVVFLFLFSLVRAASAASVIALLSMCRSAAIAIASGITVTMTLCGPFMNAITFMTYLLTNADDGYDQWSDTLSVFTQSALEIGTTILEFSLFGIGVALLHTLFRSPLVTPQSQPNT